MVVGASGAVVTVLMITYVDLAEAGAAEVGTLITINRSVTIPGIHLLMDLLARGMDHRLQLLATVGPPPPHP